MSAPDIGSLHSSITAVGSRVTCNPAPVGTDQDWLVFVAEDKFDELAASLQRDHWVVGGSMVPNEINWLPQSARFNSFTRGVAEVDNLIVTCSDEFHKRFLAATSVAKRLNLLSKDDRIALFQAVLYGASCDPQFTHFVIPAIPPVSCEDPVPEDLF